jgi:hypothetical protein
MAIPATIILIGPERPGKSTVGRLLADQLGLPFTDVSKSAAPYYAELGHSQEAVDQAWNAGELEGYLLLPSPNLDEAIAILRARTPFKVGDVPFTRYLVTHPAFRSLATQVVYTEGKTPAAICEELLSN